MIESFNTILKVRYPVIFSNQQIFAFVYLLICTFSSKFYVCYNSYFSSISWSLVAHCQYVCPLINYIFIFSISRTTKPISNKIGTKHPWDEGNSNSFRICLGFSSHSRIAHSYGDVTIDGDGLQIFTYARHLWPLSSEDSLNVPHLLWPVPTV